MALASLTQSDFSSGIYRGREAPPDAVFDIVNGLIDDEGQMFRRGGSEYYSTADDDGSTVAVVKQWLSVVYMRAVAANRVLAGAPASTGAAGIYAFSDAGVPILLGGTGLGWSRPASVGDFAIFANMGATPNTLLYYAGSRKGASYSTGTVTVTQTSATVTGSGTLWLANAEPGMVFYTNGTTRAVVKSVDSNTQITLREPWAQGSAAGAAYTLADTVSVSSTVLPEDAGRAFVATAGQRLLWACGNRIYATSRNDPFAFDAQDYLELPSNAVIVGLEGRGDSAAVFATTGMWTAANLTLDSVDAFGNQQWTLEQVTKDVVLWDDFGVAGISSGLVLPCIDDVYIAGPDFSLTSASERIRSLYRSYVKAGHQPGMAITYRGHYMLPILSNGTVVDVLVCRLDRGQAWTRWAGHSAGPAFAVLAEEVAREPLLLSVNGFRVTDVSGAFAPASANAVEADGTTSNFVLTTRDLPSGQQPGFFKNARVRYELTDDGSGGTAAPTVAVAFSSDQDAGVFTTLTERGLQGGGAGWGVSDGSKYSWALVAKKRERLRLRITVAGASASFVLRSIELLLRQSGRQ